MAYFYFDSNGFLKKIARDEEDKKNFLPFIQADKLIEKIVTDEQFEKAELSTASYNLINGEMEEIPVIGVLNNPKAVKIEIDNYLKYINSFLMNNSNEKISNFKTALENFSVPEEVITNGTSNYPISGNLIQLLRNSNIPAISLLNIW
jgi:hypothetical protein